MINVANVITVARVVLALGTLAILPVANSAQANSSTAASADPLLWTAFALTVFVIWADGLDGFFARKLNQSSKFGAILDIASDRCVELAYWIVFSTLAWVPLFVPLLFLVRGTFVDALRSDASAKGLTAFGAKTMMQSGLGKFLVASNFSRFTYAIVKALAFCLIIAAHTAALKDTVLPASAMYLVYGACVFCLLRGLPVLVEGAGLFTASAGDAND